MSTKLQLSESIARHYHHGQYYGASQSYFEYHIQGLVNQLKIHNVSEEILIVAYLHDIVEDTSCTIELITSLFGERISSAVFAITKQENESRDDYLVRCAKNKLARVVKFHDAVFNATNCLKNKNTNKYNYYIYSISKLAAV